MFKAIWSYLMAGWEARGGKCKGLKCLTVGSSEKLFPVMPSTALYKVHDDLKKADSVAVRSTCRGLTPRGL